MPIKYYEWGILKGGARPNGDPVNTGATDYGTPEQYYGATDGVSITTITFTELTKRVRIANTHDQSSLQYSFDGATWFLALPYQIIQENAEVTELYLQSYAAGTTPTYEVTGILQSH